MAEHWAQGKAAQMLAVFMTLIPRASRTLIPFAPLGQLWGKGEGMLASLCTYCVPALCGEGLCMLWLFLGSFSAQPGSTRP